ncbi:MAG TPA: phosphoglycerate kinase [Candidatus Dormibacteraeota bacterium]|nr:phosphoglycerate kinase [Candidatus Dormibacteraeota bacterium]
MDEARVEGRRVLLRVDFNVPVTKDREIRDDSRIRACLPTIRELTGRGAAVVLVTHWGRPKGVVVEALSTAPLAERLSRLLGQPVTHCPEVVGERAQQMALALKPGQLLMLENVRFRPEEEANDPAFTAQLAALAEIYVNDAFGTAHRAHASTEGVAHLLPAYAGRLMQKELEQLGQILDNPARPLLAIMGGSKLSTKLSLLRHLLARVDTLCLGGAMAATFLRARGLQVGRSVIEEDFLSQAVAVAAEADAMGVALELPTDVVVAPGVNATAGQVRVCGVDHIPDSAMLLDIGPQAVARWSRLVAEAATVVWNGPLGVYENPLFARGTRGVAEAIAASNAVSVTGGGDLQAALQTFGVASAFTHISTGGGATLEFMEGRELPGVAALLDAATAAGQ